MLRDLSSSRSAYGKYVLLLSLGLAQVASALPAPPQALSGRGILAVHRRDGHHDSNTTSSVGELQFTDARFTFYDPTEWPTGACGEDLANEDFVSRLFCIVDLGTTMYSSSSFPSPSSGLDCRTQRRGTFFIFSTTVISPFADYYTHLCIQSCSNGTTRRIAARVSPLSTKGRQPLRKS